MPQPAPSGKGFQVPIYEATAVDDSNEIGVPMGIGIPVMMGIPQPVPQVIEEERKGEFLLASNSENQPAMSGWDMPDQMIPAMQNSLETQEVPQPEEPIFNPQD